MTGTFKAVLADDNNTIEQRLAGARGWVTIDGYPVLDQPSDLASSGYLYPPGITPTGAYRGQAWTGLGSDNLPASENCDNWSVSATTTEGAFGYPDRDQGAFGLSTNGCHVNYPLICAQVDYDHALQPVVPAGDERLMFLTGGPIETAPTNAAGYDTECQSAIAALGNGRTAVAFFSTSTTTAAERLPAGERGWIRQDGVVVAKTTAELASGRWAMPIRYRANGEDMSAITTLRVGSANGPSTSGTNCNDWTVTDNSANYSGGQGNRIGGGGHSGFIRACDNYWGVYCIETTPPAP